MYVKSQEKAEDTAWRSASARVLHSGCHPFARSFWTLYVSHDVERPPKSTLRHTAKYPPHLGAVCPSRALIDQMIRLVSPEQGRPRPWWLSRGQEHLHRVIESYQRLRLLFTVMADAGYPASAAKGDADDVLSALVD